MDEKKPTAENTEKKAEGSQRIARRRNRLSYYFTAGIIMSLLDRLTNSVYKAFREGFFGRFFTAYSSEQELLNAGFVNDYMRAGDGNTNLARRVRSKLSEGFESSFFVYIFSKIGKWLLSTPLKVYGNFVLSFGLYTVFAFFVRRFSELLAEADVDMVIFGAVTIIVSMPLLLSKESLAEALGSSRSARTLLCEAFGFRDESFEVKARPSKLKANAAIVLGMLSGLLSIVIEPIYIVLVIFSVIFIWLVMSVPEIGVICSLFALPFLSLTDSPSVALAALVSLTAFGYAIKLIRGKRLFRFRLIDLSVLLFTLMIFMSGAVSAGGSDSMNEALLSCVLLMIYFLAVNMLRTVAWIRRSVLALVSSATLVAVIGILEYLFGEVTREWLDLEYFGDIKGRVVSLFDNANVLAFYLAIIFPFTLDLIFKSKTRRARFLSVFAATSIFLCTVFTFSRGAWVAILLAAALYLLIRTRRAFKAFVGLCFAIPFLPLVIPSNIVNRFLSIGDLADSSTYYRVYTWKGAARAAVDNLFGGIGYGNAAFEKVYPQYAYAGIEAAEHSHNIYLQIWLGMGIVGLVVFLLIALLFSQKCFEYIKNTESHTSAGLVGAALSAFAAALVMGLFDHIWYNYRIFFLFWAVVGIAVAAVRTGNAEKSRRRTDTANEPSAAQIDIV